MHTEKPEHDPLNSLRQKIRAIEQSQTSPLSPTKNGKSSKAPWNFGVNAVDAALPENQLNPSALHEIKPATYQDSHAALGFALALAGCRLSKTPGAALLWCLPPMMSGEFGAPYGPGLRRFMPYPENCLITEPRTHAHFLWTMEEGLNAGRNSNADTSSGPNAPGSAGKPAFALVLGTIKTIEPTPARRLSLRTGAGQTPALLLTHHKSPGISMAETRWRIARAESAPPRHLTSAPGRPKWKITLERAPNGKSGIKYILEWHHETHSFAYASPLADRAPQATRTGLSAF